MSKFFNVVCALVLGAAASALAQAPTPAPADDVAALREQVKALTETVKGLQQQMQGQQAALEKANITNALPEKSGSEPPDAAAPTSASAPASAAPTLFPTSDASVSSSTKSSAPAPTVNQNGTATATAGAFPTSDDSVTAGGVSSATGPSAVARESGLAAPITVASSGGGKNYMNISFDGQFALAYSSARDLYNVEVGDHDPQQRGFNARNLEIALDGAVDPYFEGFANIVLKLDNDNQTQIEAEEAFLQTTGLPGGVQVKAGQFFSAFGRLNPTHPHTWDFADAPLVHGLFLGPDGLRGVGAQVSWTLPLPWYSQLTGAVQNGRGGTGYSFRNPGDNGLFFGRATTDREARGLQDFVWIPRFENSFNLSDTQTVLAGVSGAFGSNETGANSRTQIYGGDLLYKWKSPRAEGGFPFVKWQSEVMYRRFEAGRGIDESFPVAETFHDWGMYSQVLWGFKKGWVAGVRGDYVQNQDSKFTNDPSRQDRSRVSGQITWYPTEFSKLRLQYNHDFIDESEFFAGRDVDSVFLQFEFILGAHGAHKF